MSTLSLLSGFLFLISLATFIKKGNSLSILAKLIFVLLVFIYIILFLFYQICNYFTGAGITKSVLYYLKFGISEAGYKEYPELIISSIFFVLFSLFISVWLLKIRLPKIDNAIYYKHLILLPIIMSLLFNPILVETYKLSLPTPKLFNGTNDTSTNFYDYYKTPTITQESQKKNIIYIYAEGLEKTYFDEKLFPNLTPNLSKIKAKSTSFENILQDKYSEHTIGGIVASQCGFPLITPSHANSMAGMDTYLESATCLGDLLSQESYYLSFYGGASLNFAAKGQFFETHSFDEIKGRNELSPLLEDSSYTNGWGLYDDTLLEIAYQRFTELSQKKENFALFTLTLDTHHPKGAPSKSCDNIIYSDGDNPILNAVACSDYLISNFINKIRESEFSNNTIIVVTSDHLAQKNSAMNLLKQGERRNLFFINTPESDSGQKIYTNALTLDIAPTILPFIGYSGDIGFGRNLLGEEKDDYKINNSYDFSLWTKNITNFWNFPEIKDSITINTDKNIVRIDDREFKYPILIEIDNNLSTKLKFQFNTSEYYTLNTYFSKLKENISFLLIDKCLSTNEISENNIFSKDYCSLSGKASNFNHTRLETKTIFTVDDILNFNNTSNAIDKLTKNNFIVNRIAHAGGGINGETYTNSLEALDNSYENNFSYFELDFILTSDEQAVCLHDWESNFKRIFTYSIDTRLSVGDFEKAVTNKAGYHPCTIATLSTWLEQHPKAYIVTDIKEDNIQILETFFTTIENYKQRIIPQIYDPNNFEAVRDMGFEQIIWTLYKYDKDNDSVLEEVEKFHGSFAITMPLERAQTGLGKHLLDKNTPTYTHTINSELKRKNYFEEYSILEIYTDFLIPTE